MTLCAVTMYTFEQSTIDRRKTDESRFRNKGASLLLCGGVQSQFYRQKECYKCTDFCKKVLICSVKPSRGSVQFTCLGSLVFKGTVFDYFHQALLPWLVVDI